MGRATTPVPDREVLTPVEARLVTVAQGAAARLHQEAEAVLNESLTTIIVAHGRDPDAARYSFDKEGLELVLKIGPKQ